jgi:lysophospholipase L1-like esterase
VTIELPIDQEDSENVALTPFWRSGAMVETVQFIQSGAGAAPEAKLLFLPKAPPRVTSATRDTVYEHGRDYVVDRASGVLSLPEGSRIPYKTRAQLAAIALPKDPRELEALIAFRFQQVEVTYAHATDEWKGYAPTIAEAALPKTLARLRAGEPLRILLIGDSIAEGGDASKFMKLPPGLPSFAEQVAKGLERAYRSPVTLNNVAQTGWTSRIGAALAVRGNLGVRNSDLIIVAFGMNDVTIRRAPNENGPAVYARSIGTIIDGIRGRAPGAEFILVSTMFGNINLELYPVDHYPIYRDQLRRLAGPGVALADLTAIWEEMLKRKSVFDFLGNGLNHPNDFGHSLYAQTILALLVDDRSANRV